MPGREAPLTVLEGLLICAGVEEPDVWGLGLGRRLLMLEAKAEGGGFEEGAGVGLVVGGLAGFCQSSPRRSSIVND